MLYLLLVAGLSFPRYVFSVLLEFFVRLDFAFSAPADGTNLGGSL